MDKYLCVYGENKQINELMEQQLYEMDKEDSEHFAKSYSVGSTSSYSDNVFHTITDNENNYLKNKIFELEKTNSFLLKQNTKWENYTNNIHDKYFELINQYSNSTHIYTKSLNKYFNLSKKNLLDDTKYNDKNKNDDKIKYKYKYLKKRNIKLINNIKKIKNISDAIKQDNKILLNDNKLLKNNILEKINKINNYNKEINKIKDDNVELNKVIYDKNTNIQKNDNLFKNNENFPLIQEKKRTANIVILKPKISTISLTQQHYNDAINRKWKCGMMDWKFFNDENVYLMLKSDYNNKLLKEKKFDSMLYNGLFKFPKDQINIFFNIEDETSFNLLSISNECEIIKISKKFINNNNKTVKIFIRFTNKISFNNYIGKNTNTNMSYIDLYEVDLNYFPSLIKMQKYI